MTRQGEEEEPDAWRETPTQPGPQFAADLRITQWSSCSGDTAWEPVICHLHWSLGSFLGTNATVHLPGGPHSSGAPPFFTFSSTCTSTDEGSHPRARLLTRGSPHHHFPPAHFCILQPAFRSLVSWLTLLLSRREPIPGCYNRRGCRQ